MKYLIALTLFTGQAAAANSIDKLADNVVAGLGLKNNHSLSFTSNNTVKLLVIIVGVMLALYLLDKVVSIILKHKNSHFAVPAFVTAIILAVSIFFHINNSMFYTVSQLTIFVSSLFYLIFAFAKNKHIYTTIFIIIAVLYNPFVQLPLNNQMFKVVDICSALFYAFYAILKLRK